MTLPPQIEFVFTYDDTERYRPKMLIDMAEIYHHKKYDEFFEYVSSLFSPELNLRTLHFENGENLSYLHRASLVNYGEYENGNEILCTVVDSFVAMANNCYENDIERIIKNIDRIVADLKALIGEDGSLSRSYIMTTFTHIASYNKKNSDYYSLSMYTSNRPVVHKEKQAQSEDRIQEVLFPPVPMLPPLIPVDGVMLESVPDISPVPDTERVLLESMPLSVDGVSRINLLKQTLGVDSGRDKLNLELDEDCKQYLQGKIDALIGDYVFVQIYKTGKKKELVIASLNVNPADYE